MSKNAKQFLERKGLPVVVADPGRQVAKIPDAQVNTILARARETLSGQTAPRAAERVPAPAPGPQKIRLPIMCGVTGKIWLGIAERHGTAASDPVLHFVGYELLRPGSSASGDSDGSTILPDRYRFEAAAGWACPLCNGRDNHVFGLSLVWQCGCGKAGAISCAGSVGREAYCACGELRERTFDRPRAFTVRSIGSPAATPNPQPPGRAWPAQTTAAGASPGSSGAALPRLPGRG